MSAFDPSEPRRPNHGRNQPEPIINFTAYGPFRRAYARTVVSATAENRSRWSVAYGKILRTSESTTLFQE